MLRTSSLGRSMIYVEEASSTNDLVREAATNNADEGLCVIAERQTRGRGRMGRSWFSPPFKNLYFSLLLRPRLKGGTLHPLSFLSCLSLHSLLKGRGLPVSLKWPNDVLVRGRKVSGTLIELEPRTGAAIVGVGINVNMEEEDLEGSIRETATSIYMETGGHMEREALLAAFLNTFEELYGLLEREGPSSIVGIWEREANLKGRSVSFEKGGQRLEGIVRGLSAEGALILEVKGQHLEVHAGEVTWY